ncbi:MAG: hypothetical protein ABW221_01465 [Vicinamibacteria bacterium]
MGMDDTTLPSGTTLLIGPPTGAQLSDEARSALAAAVAVLPGLVEAHVPQISAAGSGQPPRQVLFLVLDQDARSERVLQALQPRLSEIVPAGTSLDVLPLTLRHELLPAVRNAGSRIFAAPERTRPWWRFWA